MNIGINNSIIFNKTDKPKNTESSSAISVSENKDNLSEKAKVSGSLAVAVYGIKTSQNFGAGKTKDDSKAFVDQLSFAKDMRPEDRRNLAAVIKKGGEEADYMKRLIGLINDGKVTPTVTQALCEHGTMSELVKDDLDTYQKKVVEQGMSVKDAFLPESKTQKAGEKAAKVGDVFRVAGKNMIYVKTAEGSSEKLEMDADTYLKLFPPVERFAACQNNNGDCFFLSSVNSIMENPTTRASVYSCFTQDGNDVIVHLPDGSNPVKCENGELPKNFNKEMYTSGPDGMKLLEHMYGYQIETQKFNDYQDYVDEEIEVLEEKLDNLSGKAQDAKTIKKIANLQNKIDGYEAAKAEVEAIMSDPNHTKAFIIDDCGEFVIGKDGLPMMEEVEKINSNCQTVSNYYIGLGGDCDVVTQDFGFDSESYEIGMDDEYIDEALFAENPNDYLISAITYDASETVDNKSGRVEQEQNKSYSIYSQHAYKILPFDDENGKRMFKVTNPWNQSHRVVMDEKTLKTYFEEFAVTDLNAGFDDED
ncbi:MAG: hypothetical protein K6C94_02105 [Candidatus Gastranaerophilales bacterium]|nr:hypothetical protein [Candidatus Gastranaerophilales bacterium]